MRVRSADEGATYCCAGHPFATGAPSPDNACGTTPGLAHSPKPFGPLPSLLGANRSVREVEVHTVDQGEGCNQIGNAYADVSQHGAPLTSNFDLLQCHMACTDREDGEHESTRSEEHTSELQSRQYL